MPNQIDRDVYVTRDVLKTPIQYVRGTDYLPIVMHFRDFNIPEDASAQVFIAKPSGNIFYGAATISGNDVTIATEEQMFIELGLTLMQISIQDNNKELISFAQPVYVSQNLKSGDLPDSTTDIKFLDQAIQEANEAVDTATTAAQQAAIAVQNANQAIQNANGLISELNEQVSSLNTNYASLVNGVSIPQLNTTSKTVVGALNELNSNCLKGWVLKIKKVENEQINNTVQTNYFKTGLPLFNTVPIRFKETNRNGYVYLFWKYTNVDDSNWLVHVLGENISGAFSGDIYYLEKI